MFSRNANYYEWLPAYLEDGLDPAQKAAMTERLAADPALAAEAERLRPLVQALRESKAREASAPANSTVPSDLWLRLSDRLNPVPAPRSARPYGWLAGVGATAALAVIVALRLPQSMPTETQPPPPPVRSAPQVVSKPVSPAANGSAKIAKISPPLMDSLKPMRPLPGAKPGPPSVTTMNGGNDPFASPSAQANSSIQALPRPLPIPAPVSVAGTAPVQHRADRARTAGASEADRFKVSGEVNAAGPPPPAPAVSDGVSTVGSVQGEAAAPAPTSTQRDIPQNAYQAQPAPPANKPQAKPRVFRKPPVLAMDQARAAAPSLEAQQAALAAAVQPPLWGEPDGATQANQALMALREAGQLDMLRGKLETSRSQSPQSLGTGRMLAAVYEFGFQSELAVSERRRNIGLDGAGGEDWFALAVAEERAGNGQAAKAAYRRALELPGTLNSSHAAVARMRE